MSMKSSDLSLRQQRGATALHPQNDEGDRRAVQGVDAEGGLTASEGPFAAFKSRQRLPGGLHSELCVG